MELKVVLFCARKVKIRTWTKFNKLLKKICLFYNFERSSSFQNLHITLDLVCGASNPSPYKLVWLPHDTIFPGTYRALVSFTVRVSFKHHVYCDVVPMVACHLLFGRPGSLVVIFNMMGFLLFPLSSLSTTPLW